jgi:protein required for attachment to host cells
MPATWIVSANASRARVFAQAHAASPLDEISDLVHEESRMRVHDLETDSPVGARAASDSTHSTSAPTTPSTYEPKQTQKKREAELFAREVAEYLVKAHNEGRFDKLCLVASPEFLGLLRGLVEPRLHAALSLQIDKDYTHSTPQQLYEQIRSHRENR